MATKDRNTEFFEEITVAAARQQSPWELFKSALADRAGDLFDAIIAARDDIRRKVVEEGVFGRAVTPEPIELHAPDAAAPYSYAEYCRDQAARKPAPEAPEAQTQSVER